MTAPENQMPAIEVARRLAELGEVETAIKVYEVALTEPDSAPMDRMEAACAVLQYGEKYKDAYDTFLELYREEDELRGDILNILTDAFYTPNMKQQEKRYKKNCKLLKAYPYIFRKDFLPFEELPILFYPYDDNGVLPFHKGEERFDAYTNINDPQITHYFFRDLEKPVFAKDIFSQYELEYLKDNVRRSDWVARENHIYVHYTNWAEFCAYLCLVDMKPLLEDEKFVFLIEEEETLYPIDFKERFGIDYSQYPVKPLHIREVNRLIWHTQLYAHNGGDYFNEILHGHPNLIGDDSMMFYHLQEAAEKFCEKAKEIIEGKGEFEWSYDARDTFDNEILSQIVLLRNVTEKDALLAYYLGAKSRYNLFRDRNSRIVPALLLQPHFFDSLSEWGSHESGRIFIENRNYNSIVESGMLHQFKYIKTFTPMRRPTTSHAAVVRIMCKGETDEFFDSLKEKSGITMMPTVGDNLSHSLLNRNMMVTEHDRLFRDSRVVRFEDAKLNPTATFTALAEFLDIPYTESMTYCSNDSGKDPLEFDTNVRGFDPAPVYRTYDEFADDYERELMEYLMQDIYKEYGYGFNYYDGKEKTQEELEELQKKCSTNYKHIEESHWKYKKRVGKIFEVADEDLDAFIEDRVKQVLDYSQEVRMHIIKILSRGPKFCNAAGEPLHFMKKLEPVPELLEQPLYH